MEIILYLIACLSHIMPKFVAKIGPPRKSNHSTPGPGEESGPTLADRLNYHDVPRPFKNPYFVSRLSARTASASSTAVKKNAKQILTLERERVSGGDGFLSAGQVGQRARGEPIDTGKKQKKGGGGGAAGPGAGPGATAGSGVGGGRRGNIANLMKGRMKGTGLALGLSNGSAAGPSGTGASGISTPGETELGSGQTTPVKDESGDEDEGAKGDKRAAGAVDVAEGSVPRKEVFTYHTPAAPPSLLPPKKYCDITGLHAAYTDPRTKLRYKGLEVWHVVRNLGPGADQAYLALRGAQTSLK